VGLQKCPDCGTDVSTAAPACPKCGRPFAKAKPSAKNVGCGAVLLFIVVVGVLAAAMCSRNTDQSTVHNRAVNPPTPPVPPPSPRQVTPSFDCTKARSQAEQLICADPELAALDADLCTLYEKAKTAAPDKAAFARQNRAEWKRREATCSDKQCLLDWYALRRSQLGAILAAAGGGSSAAPLPSDGASSAESHIDQIAAAKQSGSHHKHRVRELVIGPANGPSLPGLQEWAHVAVQFVTLAMLQEVVLLDENEVRFGGLGLRFTRPNVELCASVVSTFNPTVRLVFPVLLVQNRWYPMKPTDMPVYPREIVRVRFHGGVPAILGAQPP